MMTNKRDETRTLTDRRMDGLSGEDGRPWAGKSVAAPWRMLCLDSARRY